VNAQTSSQMTALHWVAINDHIRCGESLIKAGADTTLVNVCGESALDYVRSSSSSLIYSY
jgi:ankyrin repeat protein